MLNIIDTKKNSAKGNMQLDETFLINLKDEAVLHFYEFEKPSLTYGYFVDISKFINLDIVKTRDFDSARRPTGGGIVFHLWDIAFSFLMPASHKYCFLDPLENYKFVNSIVLNAIKSFLDKIYLSEIEYKNENISFDSFCMAKPTKYDVIYKGKKIAGSSQRRKKNGYLHQSSLCLVHPDQRFLGDILLDREVCRAIIESSHPIFQNQDIENNKKIIKKRIIEEFSKVLL